jgi:hypothetical protein
MSSGCEPCQRRALRPERHWRRACSVLSHSKNKGHHQENRDHLVSLNAPLHQNLQLRRAAAPALGQAGTSRCPIRNFLGQCLHAPCPSVRTEGQEHCERFQQPMFIPLRRKERQESLRPGQDDRADCFALLDYFTETITIMPHQSYQDWLYRRQQSRLLAG